ncbi:MAG: acyl-CoA dehydrogenase family protein [Actinomycetota bacterium]
MDFAFTEEQQMLREQARSLLGAEVGPERVAELAQSDAGWDSSGWSKMAELGWTGLSVPEEAGGAGMGFLEESVLFEELGYALYPGPYLSTIGLALPALTGAPEVLGKVAAGDLRATLAFAEPEGPSVFADSGRLTTEARSGEGGWTVSGTKHLVPDGAICDLFVVAARAGDDVGLWAVARDDAEVHALETMDTTRRFARVHLQDAPATELIEPGEGSATLLAIRRRTFAALALEAVGVAQRVLELAQEYTKERKQFDKPIGTYQAVSHQVADIYMSTELARSLAYWAAWCVATDDDQADGAAAAAKAFASESAVLSCERSIQVHGGIGFTWEHILHRYYKRAQWIASFDGTPAFQRGVLARAILDG